MEVESKEGRRRCILKVDQQIFKYMEANSFSVGETKGFRNYPLEPGYTARTDKAGLISKLPIMCHTRNMCTQFKTNVKSTTTITLRNINIHILFR